jgi:hypothetical protein
MEAPIEERYLFLPFLGPREEDEFKLGSDVVDVDCAISIYSQF